MKFSTATVLVLAALPAAFAAPSAEPAANANASAAEKRDYNSCFNGTFNYYYKVRCCGLPDNTGAICDPLKAWNDGRQAAYRTNCGGC